MLNFNALVREEVINFSGNCLKANWSISKEESPRKKEESETVHKEEYFGDSEYSHKRKKTYTKSSHSTSKLPDPFPDHPRQPARVSTSQLPSYQTSSSSDSDNRLGKRVGIGVNFFTSVWPN